MHKGKRSLNSNPRATGETAAFREVVISIWLIMVFIKFLLKICRNINSMALRVGVDEDTTASVVQNPAVFSLLLCYI